MIMINIMIAEDNKSQNELYYNFLQRDNNIKIISRNYDGLSTIQDYRKLKPDVLILDSNLPKLNGIEVIDNLCIDITEKRKSNIIVISGDDFFKSNIINTSKIYKIFIKPCNYDTLLNTVKEIRR